MNKDALKQRCLAAIDRRREEIIALAEEIYREPELGYREVKTTERMARAFSTLSDQVETGIAYTGCKIASPKKEGPVVAVMGELDCVMCKAHPDSTKGGNVHACGHHAQLADLYGCAVGLLSSGVMEELDGQVEFVAIPAEECVDYEYRGDLIRKGEIQFYGGKQEFLRRGGMDNIDLVLQCHMMEMEDPSTHCIINTDCAGFMTKIVTFRGKGAHAGFAPHEGINALNMAELALNNIHALRETFRDEDKIRVSAVITQGGELVNVVPGIVRMQIMVRAFTIEAMLDANRKVTRALKAGAMALGGRVEIRDQVGYLPLRTDRELSALYRQNMIDYTGAAEDSFVMDYQTAGSTDLGDISQLKPCMHIWTEGITGGLHSEDFRVADPEKAYIVPAKMLALTVIDLLYDQARKAKSVLEHYRPSYTTESYLEFMKEHSGLEEFDGGAV